MRRTFIAQHGRASLAERLLVQFCRPLSNQSIDEYITTWNDNPNPYVWRKSAQLLTLCSGEKFPLTRPRGRRRRIGS